MTWFTAFFRSRRFRVLTVAVTASLPAFALAQATAKRPQGDDRNAPTTLGAERLSGRPDREVFLDKDAEVSRGETVVKSDSASYHVVDDRVEAKGNVRMRRFGDFYTGDELKLKMDTGQGYVTNPTYKLEVNNAQGRAERIDFEAEDQARVIEGTYSTCEGMDPDWYLKADTLDLDKGRDIGIASKSVVYFKGVPIMGTPFMSFPLSDARKSGILPPTLGATNKGGLEIMLPYYLNIAPNRDMTFYPRLMSKRGLQLGLEGRYLGETYRGETWVEGLYRDQQTKTNRYAISSNHTQTLAPNLVFSWNINSASDDDYPNDFPNTLTQASQRLLLREFNLGYSGGNWLASARTTNYQVLQDPIAPIGRPYDRLPQLIFQSWHSNVNGFDMSVYSEFTRFWHPTLVRGDRFVVNPRVGHPIVRPGYFLKPSLSVHAATYDLTNQAAAKPSSLSRTLPTFSLDSGLVFEREASLFGQEMTQTLEPRLFYVYTPYRDQSNFPTFDTSIADFNFTQIFSENRYSGHDIISNANQLTAAIVSRYLEPSGAERMSIGIGQRYYFTDRNITGATTNETRSDLLLAVTGKISSTLTVDANTQYSQSLRTQTRANYGVAWRPEPKKVLNLQYKRDVPNSLEQIDVSGQWPLARRWYGVGRINYSIPDSKFGESLLGLEYKDDCWVLRMVAQRTPTATGVASTALFVQLELTGLSKIGSNPIKVLKSNVPGYQLVNQP